MKKLTVILLALVLAPTCALAQVRQGGHVTPNHVPMWTTNGVIGDGGTAAQGFLSSLGVTASGPGICQNSGLVTGPYNQLCLSTTQTGGGQISLWNRNGATGGLSLSLNGVVQGVPTISVPTIGGGHTCFLNSAGQIGDCTTSTVAGPFASTVGNFAIWDNLTGTLLANGPSQTGGLTASMLAAGAAATNVGTLGGVLTGTLPNPGLGTNQVANGNLAQMGANTIKGNATGSTANAADLTGQQAEGILQFTQTGTGATQRLLDAKVKDSVWVSVTDFGADPTGVADSTTAIQDAINSLPTTGGVVWLPVGNYKISSTITIGNGSSSAASTRAGVILRGAGNSLFIGVNPWTWAVQNGVKFTWAGGASEIIKILGPLMGWGLENLYIDGGSTATNCISVISGQFGENKNLSLINCRNAAIASTVVSPFTGESDSIHNTWKKTNITLPNVAGAKGIILTGTASSNTDYNTFIDTFIDLHGSALFGIYLQACDSNTFINTQMSDGGSNFSVVFDYTVNDAWPASNTFYHIDPGRDADGTLWSNTGAPGGSARPNYVYGVVETNGGVNPNVANTYPALPVVMTPSLHLTAQTGSVGATTLFTPVFTGMYRISVYLGITTTGNNVDVNAGLSWNDTAASQTAATSLIAANGLNYTQQTFEIYVAANQPVNYSTTVSGAIGTGEYQLHMTAEKLN